MYTVPEPRKQPEESQKEDQRGRSRQSEEWPAEAEGLGRRHVSSYKMASLGCPVLGTGSGVLLCEVSPPAGRNASLLGDQPVFTFHYCSNSQAS